MRNTNYAMRKLVGIILLLCPLVAIAQVGKTEYRKWKPNLESISNHETPGWLMDAKIGI